MRTIFPLLAVAAGLVACQQAASNESSQTASTSQAAATSLIEEAAIAPDPTVYPDGAARWLGVTDAEESVLTYAVPETDDVRLSLSCHGGSGQVRLWRETWDGDEPTFALSSGEVEATYTGVVNPDGMAPQLDGQASARDPIFEAFRSTGVLTLSVGGEAHDMSAPAGARPMISGFFEHCTRPVP